MLIAAAHAGVTVVAPAAGISASSPVHFVANATPDVSTAKITYIRIYVDNVSLYGGTGKTVDTLIPMADGDHKITVQAWDNAGAVYRSSMTLNVAPVPVPPATAIVFNNIEEMNNWTSCDVCSGAGGAGAETPHWIAQNITTPSLDGNSAEFHLEPAVKYASALWWRQLGVYDSMTHFQFEGDFFFADSTAPQALEFDVNQSLGGWKYIFGTECDFRGKAHYWRIYDATRHWVSTGVPCTPTVANTWHNFKWEFERTADGHTRFLAVTVDGVRTTVNTYFTPRSQPTARELNVAVQLDGNSVMTPYSTWVDNLKLTAW